MDKVVCFGKNYLDHAKELGDAVPEKPIIFLKPPSVMKSVSSGETLALTLPTGLGEVHHECEVAVRLARGGFKMTSAEAAASIGEVTVGLDMTLRTLQNTLKKNSHPWTLGKVFPDSAVAGPWRSVKELPLAADLEFSLELNGKIRQSSRVGMMMMPVAELIAYASQYFPLCAGDVLFTGTPAGVGPVAPGDRATLRLGPIAYEVRWS